MLLDHLTVVLRTLIYNKKSGGGRKSDATIDPIGDNHPSIPFLRHRSRRRGHSCPKTPTQPADRETNKQSIFGKPGITAEAGFGAFSLPFQEEDFLARSSQPGST